MSRAGGEVAGVNRGRVTFVGAGPGAADLITLRGARALTEADVVVWAASLVHPDMLDHARDDARIVDSAQLTLEQTVALYAEAAREGLHVVRLHSGDPGLWGAVAEQLERCDELGLETSVVPGVSAFSAVAAAVGRELTVPEVAQSVVLTRLGGGKTPMPAGESVTEFARHGTTMAIFLAAARSGQLRAELVQGGYPEDTPVVVAYQVSWPDELIVWCTVGTLAATVKAHKLWKHTLFLVGPALRASGTRSHLYHPGHFHGFRRAEPAARAELRGPEPARLPEPAELREPDLPRTAKVRQRALRTGWTTGTCCSAAAKAAAELLATGVAPCDVEVALPSGRRISFAVERCESLPGGAAEASVVKDAGDDPDVTHGAHLTATVSWAAGSGIELTGGDGVGVVTRPGLGLQVGGPAINPVPREMITQAVREVTDRGLRVTISVPGGEKMARKTTNRRLGILGGISILGTTGVVRPFSTASWRASVMQAVQVMAAQGEPTLVLCTGGRTERGAIAMLPDLDHVCFVEVGDFTGAALRTAAEHGLREVVFVGMVGKLSKLAAGVLMTHYTRSTVDTSLLGRLTAQAGGGAGLVAEVEAANTARHGYELWQAAGLLRAAGDLLCGAVAEVLERFTEGAMRADVAMVDFTGRTVVAATRPEWVNAA